MCPDGKSDTDSSYAVKCVTHSRIIASPPNIAYQQLVTRDAGGQTQVVVVVWPSSGSRREIGVVGSIVHILSFIVSKLNE
jgi:hypothetical protein